MFQLAIVVVVNSLAFLADGVEADKAPACLGQAGLTGVYHLADSSEVSSTVETILFQLGPTDLWNDSQGQWMGIKALKKDGTSFDVWLLCRDYPSRSLADARGAVLRYMLRRKEEGLVEFRHGLTGLAVLPATGAWPYLVPHSSTQGTKRESEVLFPEMVEYLGHRYSRQEQTVGPSPTAPAPTRVVNLRPDLLIGVPHNTRQADETRRYDGSDYEYVPLTRDDYTRMIAAGLNCFHSTPEDAGWLENAGVFYWGVGGADILFPESLYQPQYLGSDLFLDEPAVTTRDYKLRPRLKEDPSYRHAIGVQDALAAFQEHYAGVIETGAPTRFVAGIASRTDIDLGSMTFRQANLYTWETMISSAAYQLLYSPETPDAIVFEPPGRVGARRMLPGMNMSYGCEIPVASTNNLTDIIVGFLRGAARASGKQWGFSIYGGVDVTEASAMLSRAYELGATRFFYWDSAQLACVPFGEVLDLTRHLTEMARTYPERDLDRLRRAAEVAILLPAGYDLGHVQMGLGNLWGLPELNLERRNQAGVSYRTVMGHFFTEVERCLRQGVTFDLLWDLPNLGLEGYREVVRIQEDGKIELRVNDKTSLLDGPRTPERPEGEAPKLTVEVTPDLGPAPCTAAVAARITEGSAPVYYSPYPDAHGVHHNQVVRWELYGPADEDYSVGAPSIESTSVSTSPDGKLVAQTVLHLEKPGSYRLRTATTDLMGRSCVVWTDLRCGP